MTTPEELLASYLSGELNDPQDRHALAVFLQSNESVAEQLHKHVTIEIMLRQHFTDDATRVSRLLGNLRYVRERGTASKRHLLVQGVRSRLPKRRSSRRHTSSPLLIAAVLMMAVSVGIIIGYFPTAAKDQAIWNIIELHGSVSTVNGESLTIHSTVEKDARIKTERASSVTLRFFDGSQITVAESSEVILSTRMTKGTLINLMSGQLNANVLPQPSQQPFTFHTEHGDIAVVGTSFQLQHRLQGTAINMHTGSVTMSNQHGEIAVSAGQQGIMHASYPPLLQQQLPTEIMLSVTDIASMVSPWRRLSDDLATNKQALAVTETNTIPFQAEIINQSAVTLHFMAQAHITYRIWVRGRALGGTDNDLAHDAFALGTGSGTLSAQPSGEFMRETLGMWANDKAYFNGLASRQGYHWICGNYKPLGKPEGLDVEEPITIQFSYPGQQTLMVYPIETPIAIDAILLSTTTRDRPPNTAPP